MKRFLTALFLGFAALMLASFASAETTLKSGLMMPQAKDIKPFILTHYSSEQKSTTTFSNKDLNGKWTLMFFGFTNCPALCPTTMAQLENAYGQWEKAGFTPMPQVVFVSVDPERDTAEKVNTFATTFNPKFIGVRTDDMKTLSEMTHEMNAMFEKVKLPSRVTGDKDKKSDYTISHTGDIMVLNPQGQFVAMLTMPHEASDIVSDYETIVKAAPATKKPSSGGLFGWFGRLF